MKKILILINNYKDDIPAEVKESRVAELMEIQQNISAELNACQNWQSI